MKAFLLVLTILMFSVNGFAKGKSKSAKQDAYKFDFQVYYKLKFPERKKYLEAYIKFAQQVEAQVHAEHKSEFDLFRLIFPTADASYGASYCFSGGIFYNPRDGKKKDCGPVPAELMTPPGTSSVMSCPSGQTRCASYFGVDSSNNLLCWSGEERYATVSCGKKSSPEAVERLNQLMANRSSEKGQALNKLLDLELNKNDLIGKYCLERSNKGKGGCAALAKAVADYRKIAGIAAPPEAGDSVGGRGCADAEVQAIESAGKNINRVWYQLLKTGTTGCNAAAFQNMQQKMGVCEIGDSALNVDFERDLRSGQFTNLKKSLDNLAVGKNIDSRSDEWKSFTYYMGITPDEFKKIFCAKDTSEAATAALGLTQSAAAIGADNFGQISKEDHQNRRQAFKSCAQSVFKKQTIDGANVKPIYTSNRSHSVCQFKTATFNVNDIIQNTGKYTGGKYFFSDNKTGQCYRLEQAGTNCGSIGSHAERSNSGVVCGANSGTTLPTYYKLTTIGGGDSSTAIVKEGETLRSSFMFQEYDCGSTARHCYRGECDDGLPPPGAVQ